MRLEAKVRGLNLKQMSEKRVRAYLEVTIENVPEDFDLHLKDCIVMSIESVEEPKDAVPTDEVPVTIAPPEAAEGDSSAVEPVVEPVVPPQEV